MLDRRLAGNGPGEHDAGHDESERHAHGACEACGAELEAGARSEGGTYGLSFCADCRDRLDRSAIQIHFCDSCGGSIPLYAVEEGAALVGDGRILCLRCRTPARRGGVGWVLLVTALVALAIGAAAALWSSGGL
jgi:hypothetical protein